MAESPFAVFDAPEHQPFDLPGECGGALLVHGFGGTPAEMRGLADALNAEGWAARGLLLPGFGSDFGRLGQVSRRDWVTAVETALAQVRRQHRRTLLVGFSMGGAASVLAASKAPPDALVLINPFTKIDNLVWNLLPVLKYALPQFKPFRLIKLDFDSPEAQRNIRQYMPNADLADPAVREAVMGFALPTRALDELRAIGEAAYARAPRLRARTLVVQSTRDTTVPPDRTRQLAQHIPSAHLVEINAEHNFVQYDPGALKLAAQAILTWLREEE